MINRKQFLEYKLKLSSRLTNENGGGTNNNNSNSTINASERAALITELTEIHNNLEVLMNQYERRFGESYLKMITTTTTTTTTNNPIVGGGGSTSSGSSADIARGTSTAGTNTTSAGDGVTVNTPIKLSSSLSSPPPGQLHLRHIPSTHSSTSSLPSPQQQQQQQQQASSSSSSIRSGGGIPLNPMNSSPNVRVMHHTR